MLQMKYCLTLFHTDWVDYLIRFVQSRFNISTFFVRNAFVSFRQTGRRKSPKTGFKENRSDESTDRIHFRPQNIVQMLNFSWECLCIGELGSRNFTQTVFI